MKTLIFSSVGLLSTSLVFAQGKTDSFPNPPTPPNPVLNHEALNSVNPIQYIEPITPIIVIGLLVLLAIYLTKFILEYRLKNKIIDRGISEQLAASILEKNNSSKKDDSIKWVLLLTGIGTGLIVSYYTTPLNMHSLAIMAFSIASSYLGYFFYLKNQNK